MALRLRRGVDAERLTIIPQEGELIYVTDTKGLYAGDGATVGGNLINNIALFGIDQLTDVDISSTPLLVGDVLEWNGTQFVPGNNEIIEGSSYRFNIIGDDSTILVDTSTGVITGTINTSIINVPAAGVVITTNNADSTNLAIESQDNASSVTFTATSAGTLTNNSLVYGRIMFEKNDINGKLIKSSISGGDAWIALGVDQSGSFANSSSYATWTGEYFGIGTLTPSSALDVRGNLIVSGTGQVSEAMSVGYMQFGLYTTATRPVGQNGMVVYNSTDNRFQGYQNNTWINLDDGTVG